jgi:hypothetical protein
MARPECYAFLVVRIVVRARHARTICEALYTLENWQNEQKMKNLMKPPMVPNVLHITRDEIYI